MPAPNARERGDLSDQMALQVFAERERLGLTRAQFAAKAGVPRITLLRIERGERVMDISQMERLAKAAGIEANELVRRAESRLDPPTD